MHLLEAYWMHQCVLEEKSAVLHGKIYALLDSLNFPDEIQASSAAEHLLTACNIALFYSDFSAANKFLNDAKRRCQQSSLLTGILGKRTRFQETSYAQLVVELQSHVPEP
jgi:hypothetical protein